MAPYPATLNADKTSAGFVVTFPDIPEAVTQGNDRDDAMHHAVGVLETAVSIYIEQGGDLPVPSRWGKNGLTVALSATSAAKAALYQAVQSERVSRAGLVRRMRVKKRLDTTVNDAA